MSNRKETVVKILSYDHYFFRILYIILLSLKIGDSFKADIETNN